MATSGEKRRGVATWARYGCGQLVTIMEATVVSTLRRITSDLTMFRDGREVPRDVFDAFIISLEFCYREMVILDSLHQLSAIQRGCLDHTRNALTTLRLLQEESNNNFRRPVHAMLSEGPGRPTLLISEEQLTFLVESNFTVPQIATVLGVSVRTVRRRMTDYGLSIRMQYAVLSDQELDGIVSAIQEQFPMCGNRQMQGHLLSKGYRVQQVRIRESQRRVDPNGSVIRRLHVLNRRKYCVPAPLSLYHIDGNHKLIR